MGNSRRAATVGEVIAISLPELLLLIACLLAAAAM